MAFLDDLEKKVLKQLKSQRIGFLLGAGSSYLDGAGYPLMCNLWDLKNKIKKAFFILFSHLLAYI